MTPRIVVQYPASMSGMAELFDIMQENLRRMLVEEAGKPVKQVETIAHSKRRETQRKK